MRRELLALLLLGTLAVAVARVAAAATATHARTYSAERGEDLGAEPVLMLLSLVALLIGLVGTSGPVARAAWGRGRWLRPRRVAGVACLAVAGYAGLQVPAFFAHKKGIDINREGGPGRYAEYRDGKQVRVLPPDEDREMLNRERRFWSAAAMTFSYVSLALLLGTFFERHPEGEPAEPGAEPAPATR